MPRRGRASSPPRMASRPPAPVHSAPRSPVPAPAAPSSMMTAPVGGGQQPGLLKQMAATAGGVAVGSAVGHVVGHTLLGGIGGGGGGSAVEQQSPAPVPTQPIQNHQENVCGFELRQFLQCAQNQSDLSLCEGFNAALRECRQSQGMYQ